jgi:ADP-heptose:LPS heptosyltransferase
LAADPQRVASWRRKLDDVGGRSFKVGLVWAGRPTHKNDHNRSLSLKALMPLANVNGVRFICLQQGEAANQSIGGFPMETLEPLTDFADTAAVIANLDLVISVDTAVAHLAGAMGWPVWLLNPFVADWRWLLDREDSPWYPTMRIFRQKAPGDWGLTIREVQDALRALVLAKSRR